MKRMRSRARELIKKKKKKHNEKHINDLMNVPAQQLRTNKQEQLSDRILIQFLYFALLSILEMNSLSQCAYLYGFLF